jgi:hypothetical protein
MYPDTMNIIGVLSMVFLCLFCVFLTFQAWFDARNRDLTSMRQHLRMIGVSQFVILFSALSIGADIVASCRVAIEKTAEVRSAVRGEYHPDTVLHASR